jgi:3-oxoacyl-[acyl-carrier protein] reductase
MSDFLVELGANPSARKLITSLGLPVPMPEKLRRDLQPWAERPLHDKAVVVGSGPDAEMGAPLAHALCRAGANPFVVGGRLEPWQSEGVAWGRPAQALATDELPEKPQAHALVFDATGLRRPEQLRSVYDFFHPRVRAIARSGRVVVLGRPGGDTPAAAATSAALEGFVRSAARELGRRGATANLLLVEPGAEARVEPLLRFLLSYRSAFVSGQPLLVRAKVATKAEPPLVRPLEGKVALVTGAARGIGAATARALAREGARVVVLDRPEDDGPASQVAAEVHGTLLLCDITADDAAHHVAAFVKDRFGRLDILVHNAGITRDKTLANMKAAWWDQTLDVNLFAVLRVTEALEPLLREGGRVVCLSSIAGIAGNVGQTNYSASKAGIIGFVRAQAERLAERGIAVNAVAPGFIETRLTQAIPIATREVARRLSNLAQGGLPEDVAEVLTFLSSPGAHGLTGQVLRVCGGAYVGA